MTTGDPERRRRLLEDPIGKSLLGLAVPMMIGIAASLAFNLVDTFWVGRLGPHALAAMGFTFPVAMVITNLTIGLSIGATAVIARAIGEGREAQVRALTTDALILVVLVVGAVSMAGLATIDPLFTLLGADARTLPLIREYMVPWYAGVGLFVVPLLGNGAIRATGDTKWPAVVMVIAGLVNAVVDPILIFGLGPVPAMGLAGAAYATVAAWGIALAGMMYLLHARERMLTFARPTLARCVASWRAMLHVGIPAAGTNLLTPLAAGAITRIVASHGPHAVAAYGVGTRIEGLALIGVYALTASITPFVGQNLGAGQSARVEGALAWVSRAALVWGGGCAAVLFLLAGPIARVFNDDAEVIALTEAYLRIVPVSFAPYGLAILVASFFNAMDMPLKATGLAAMRLVALAIPLAWIGSALFDLTGVFLGIVAANAIMGVTASLYARRELRAVRASVARAAG